MSYYQLDVENIVSYIQQVPALRTRFHALDRLVIKEIGDGNLNFVFLVQEVDNPDADIIIKQAVPYVRCLGEAYKLGLERMSYEMQSLCYFATLSPEHIPHIYHADKDMALLAMQYLGQHRTARETLFTGQMLPKLIDHISTFMAKTLLASSPFAMSGEMRRDLMAQYMTNKDLCAITETYIFTEPFADRYHPCVTDAVKASIMNLKFRFMSANESLVHGDLHTGSLLVNRDETFVIDSEFAVFGPIGFDVGLFIANLVFAAQRLAADNKPTQCQQLLKMIKQCWQQFEDKFIHLWQDAHAGGIMLSDYLSSQSQSAYQSAFMRHIFSDTVGFACCEILRRLLGVAKVADIETITDPACRAQAKDQLIEFACHLLPNYTQVRGIEQFTEHLQHCLISNEVIA